MKFDALRERLCTVAAIPVTPLAEDGSVDWEVNARNLQRLAAAGVAVLAVNGNTSEFYSLTPEEQQRHVREAAAAVGAQALLITGIGYDTATASVTARAVATRARSPAA